MNLIGTLIERIKQIRTDNQLKSVRPVQSAFLSFPSQSMRLLYIQLLLFITGFAVAQPQLLTLDDVVQMAKSQSISAKQAATQKQTSYWQYRTFQAGFKPQLSLDGSLPNFERSFIQVTQPDGTISFQPISNNNSVLNLSLSQNIAPTGGSVFV